MKINYIEIGDTATLKGVKVVCLQRRIQNSCIECAFKNANLDYCDDIACNEIERYDKINVIFKKL